MATVSGQAGGRIGMAMWHIPRTRGAMSGFLLVLLGVWGGLIPFVGPNWGYAYTPATSWTMTAGRLWLEVLPGAAAVLGGLIMLASTHRAVAVWASWLATVGGAWFVVGPSLSRLWTHGAPQAGTPTATSTLGVMVQEIGFFYGVGVVILFLSAVALGRLSVVGVRDAQAASARAAAGAPATFEPPANAGGADETTRIESPRHASGSTEENPTG